MTVHIASIRPHELHLHGQVVRVATGVATGLLSIASLVALGAAGTEAAVLGIAVLAPLVLLGSLTIARSE